MIETSSTRTTKSSLNFKSAFRIGNDEEVFPAGLYEVQTTEAVHEGNERTVYRRISTVLIVAEAGKRRYCEVDPSDLEEATRRDDMTQVPAGGFNTYAHPNGAALLPCGTTVAEARQVISVALTDQMKENNMAKSQRRSNKEIRKPKKPAPPKPNASNPSQNGALPMPPKD